jgi:hypothetical protein
VRADYEMVGASPFPRHWIYDHSGRHVAKSGLLGFGIGVGKPSVHRHLAGGIDTPALIRPAVSDVEREISDLVMGRSPPSNVCKPGRCSYGRAILAPSYSYCWTVS